MGYLVLFKYESLFCTSKCTTVMVPPDRLPRVLRSKLSNCVVQIRDLELLRFSFLLQRPNGFRYFPSLPFLIEIVFENYIYTPFQLGRASCHCFPESDSPFICSFNREFRSQPWLEYGRLKEDIQQTFKDNFEANFEKEWKNRKATETFKASALVGRGVFVG